MVTTAITLAGEEEEEGEINALENIHEEQLLELRREVESSKEELARVTGEHEQNIATARQTALQSMEAEFTCGICHELLITSTTLPCAHSFCELCLRVWLRRHNPGSSRRCCPICRHRIDTKCVHSVVLDSAIEAMIETMGEERRERWRNLKRQREEEMRVEDQEDEEGVDGDGDMGRGERVRNMIYRPDERDREEERRRDEDRRDRARMNNNYPQQQHNHRERRRSASRSPTRRSYRPTGSRHAPYFIPQPYHNNNNNNNNNNSGSSENNGAGSGSGVHARLGQRPVVGHPDHPSNRFHQNLAGGNFPVVIMPPFPMFHNFQPQQLPQLPQQHLSQQQQQQQNPNGGSVHYNRGL